MGKLEICCSSSNVIVPIKVSEQELLLRLKKEELQDRCQAQGLSKSGNKPELAERLLGAGEHSEQGPPAASQQELLLRLKKEELKDRCQAQGLSKSGNKPELVARLLGADEQPVQERLPAASEQELLMRLKNEELQDRCQAQGLSKSGNKPELVARLLGAGEQPVQERLPAASEQELLMRLKKEELKDRCQAQGLSKSGNKPELVARLLGAGANGRGGLPSGGTSGGSSMTSKAPAAPYIPNPQRRMPPLMEKLNRKISQHETRFVHTTLTSCHEHPKKRDENSWIRVWKTATSGSFQSPAGPCSFAHCSNPATLGSHVSNYGSTTLCASWYIVPACKDCNNKHNQAGELRPGTKLVKVVQGPPAAITRSRALGQRQVLIGKINHDTADELLERPGGKDPAAIAVLSGHRKWPASKGMEAKELPVRVWPKDF